MCSWRFSGGMTTALCKFLCVQGWRARTAWYQSKAHGEYVGYGSYVQSITEYMAHKGEFNRNEKRQKQEIERHVKARRSRTKRGTSYNPENETKNSNQDRISNRNPGRQTSMLTSLPLPIQTLTHRSNSQDPVPQPPNQSHAPSHPHWAPPSQTVPG